MGCIEHKSEPISSNKPHQKDFNSKEDMIPRAPLNPPRELKNGGRVKSNDVAPEGLYRPNYNILTPNMRSPEYVQMSTAAAITLGVTNGKMYRCECTRCLNLLLTYPEGCRANCAYCGLARHREADRDFADRNFIRVDWPSVPIDRVIEIVEKQGENTPFHRMCISMITHPNSEDDTFTILKKWTDKIPTDLIPVSILSNPTTMTRADVQKPKILVQTFSPLRSTPPHLNCSIVHAAEGFSLRTDGLNIGKF